jgi:hypothetical protein
MMYIYQTPTHNKHDNTATATATATKNQNSSIIHYKSNPYQ